MLSEFTGLEAGKVNPPRPSAPPLYERGRADHRPDIR